ncbi:TonB family protein [Chryseobacterium koreense]|uniref:TonB family protein n=1 Tax=Chryseobacterium koreense TaxID=232216 RepID=UPI00065AC89A|nr:TonB family protein [Chryseobacterium koreense]MBB5332099.1 TonB family protein [Chryseobacterium koreense]
MKFIPLFLFFAFSFNAQVLENYPDFQTPYIGGYQAYYKDFHDIVKEKNLQPCSNPNEIYLFTVLVTEDGSLQFIKDLNEKNVNNNKCAYQLAREVAKYQNNWNPAVVDRIKKSAVARFIIYPADLFENYTEGYVPNYTPPIYYDKKTGERRNFSKDFVMKFDKKRFNWYDLFLIMAEFTVTTEGKVKDIVITKSSGVEQFDKEIKNTINILSKTWKPATINGNPIEDRYSFAIKGITEVEYN